MFLHRWEDLASQAKMYTKYVNVKTKLHKTLANIYFNKECLKHKLTPTYAKIKIKDTNKADTENKPICFDTPQKPFSIRRVNV